MTISQAVGHLADVDFIAEKPGLPLSQGAWHRFAAGCMCPHSLDSVLAHVEPCRLTVKQHVTEDNPAEYEEPMSPDEEETLF